jgi:hypothetical protein
MTDEAIIMLREESYKIAGTQAMLEYQDIHSQAAYGTTLFDLELHIMLILI